MNNHQRQTIIIALLHAYNNYIEKERALARTIRYALDKGITIQEIEHILDKPPTRKKTTRAETEGQPTSNFTKTARKEPSDFTID